MFRSISAPTELPVGFVQALDRNPEAKAYFSAMRDEEKRAVVLGAHNMDAKALLRHYVNSLVWA